jgi:hypothetical protein
VADLSGTQPHQAGTGSFSEGLGQPGVRRGVDLRCILLAFSDEAPMGGEA